MVTISGALWEYAARFQNNADDPSATGTCDALHLLRFSSFTSCVSRTEVEALRAQVAELTASVMQLQNRVVILERATAATQGPSDQPTFRPTIPPGGRVLGYLLLRSPTLTAGLYREGWAPFSRRAGIVAGQLDATPETIQHHIRTEAHARELWTSNGLGFPIPVLL